MRGVHHLVSGLALAFAQVGLHLVADDRALGVEHREPGAELVGEREQVELLPELAVVALLGLGQARQVVLLVLQGRPGGAVDALELRVLLRAHPVRGGRAHDLDRADELGRGQVRAAAEVAPDALAVAVVVVVRGELAAADLHDLVGVGALALGLDQLELVRLVCEFGAGLVEGRVLAAVEGLPLLDDLEHALLDGLEVVGVERLGDVEVVVETVGDGWSDAELGLVQLLHRLRHDVRGGVAHDVEPVRAAERHGLDLGVGFRGPGEVAELAVGVADDDDRVRPVAGEPGFGHRGSARGAGSHPQRFYDGWAAVIRRCGCHGSPRSVLVIGVSDVG